MKKKIISTILAFTLVLTTCALAADYRNGDYQRGNSQQQGKRPMHAGMLIGKTIHESAVANVLSNLTGQDVSQENLDVRDFLQANEIDRETFRTAMDNEFKAMVADAVECGFLSQEQGNEITQMLDNRPEPPAEGSGGSGSHGGQRGDRPARQ